MTERRSIEFTGIAATKLLELERKHKAAPVGILLAGDETVAIDRHGRVIWLDRLTEQREAELAGLLSEAIKALPVNHETHIKASALLAKREAERT